MCEPDYRGARPHQRSGRLTRWSSAAERELCPRLRLHLKRADVAHRVANALVEQSEDV